MQNIIMIILALLIIVITFTLTVLRLITERSKNFVNIVNKIQQKNKLPVKPTFLRHVAHRFFFFLASLSSLSSLPLSVDDAATAAAIFSACVAATCAAICEEHSSDSLKRKKCDLIQKIQPQLFPPQDPCLLRRLNNRRFLDPYQGWWMKVH